MTDDMTDDATNDATDDATHPEPALMLERTLRAPPDEVWPMWTDAERFAGWYGPTGASVTVLTMDVVVGGRRHILMEMPTPNGPMQMWFVGQHREIDPPARLVYTESVSNADGDVLSPSDMGMPGDHPRVTEVTVELRRVDGGTHLVLTHAGVPAGSPGEAGWTMALDELAAAVGG